MNYLVRMINIAPVARKIGSKLKLLSGLRISFERVLEKWDGKVIRHETHN